MEKAELDVFKCGDVDFQKLIRKYTIIEMEGKKLAVRTFIYNDDKSKKTLLMTHGFGMSGCLTSFKIIEPLAKHYRLVIFDHGGWGLNTKIQDTQALESPETSEAYIVEWWKKFVDEATDKGDLPPKFYLTAHSAGGMMAMMYASQHPERIEALFLQSPAGSEPFDEATYDPYSIRIWDEPPFQPPSKKDVDAAIQGLKDHKHLMAAMQ